MDSRYLQSFVFVVELGSIAEAARRLDLTPAAVAQRVKMLETEPFLRYDRNVVGGQLADTCLRQHGIRPSQRCELDGLGAIAPLVDRGLGVSLVPDGSSRELAGLSLKKWALPHASPRRLVGLLWGRSSARLRLVQAFLAAAESVRGS